jgi:replication-associated recombination protein RarA
MISKRPRNWAELQDSRQLGAELRAGVEDRSLRFGVFVLYGRPGRGKTTLCKLICSEAAYAKEINGSSERRKEELRDALTEFTTHWSMARVKWKAVENPTCVLFVDEADGLGPWGQGMLASYLSEMETKELPPTSGLGRIFFACNDLAKLHPSILSKAAMVREIPRPSADDLMRCAIAAGAKPDDDSGLVQMCRSADGDYRTLLQMLEMRDDKVRTMDTTTIPKPMARILMLRDMDAPGMDVSGLVISTLEETWRLGSRTDVLVEWIEQILPLVQDELHRAKLLRLRTAWQDAQPETLLQVVGAYFRHIMGMHERL